MWSTWGVCVLGPKFVVSNSPLKRPTISSNLEADDVGIDISCKYVGILPLHEFCVCVCVCVCVPLFVYSFMYSRKSTDKRQGYIFMCTNQVKLYSQGLWYLTVHKVFKSGQESNASFFRKN